MVCGVNRRSCVEKCGWAERAPTCPLMAEVGSSDDELTGTPDAEARRKGTADNLGFGAPPKSLEDRCVCVHEGGGRSLGGANGAKSGEVSTK